ncbi:hypothetical protein [Sphingobacterium pedocola]|uniref:HTH cro/C1-type domain-containing protein n=1 Tax=Sphingobacterium pedocola TaxID=2082722 RepID=A0ABR9T2R7_9SPHI|nr:hypothetical protein [Sphingobacterium pedocola]MBE8719344.1 hypothetical protein [Sphingobacterium pedocola]
MAKINKSSLYVINRIKLKRLVNGDSTRKLSEKIDKSEGYVGMCESSAVVHKYNSADYPLIADELGCELSDITPPDDWQVSDSHDKVDKVVVSLSDPAFVLKVLEGIKASPKAEVLEDLDKLYKHLALTTKNPEEITVVKKVWEEFN